jgi:hypothetical protein
LSLAIGRVGIILADGSGATTVDGWLSGDICEPLGVVHVREARDKASATA